MPLQEYRRKRKFNRTSEPRGKMGATRGRSGWRFVIQKHAASRLHYDFRLELDGVLKSWAVPKGPCLDPSQKRLAVQVEDHPLEYGDFEGVIPAGQYGGGSVIVWDRGTWTAAGDAAEGYRQGKLKFHLDGEKLRGGWMLARMLPRPGEKGENWLLIKERDDEARTLSEFDILEEEPASVASGRTVAEVGSNPDRTWTSHKAESAAPEKPAPRKAPARSSKKKKSVRGSRQKKGAGPTAVALEDAVKAPFPDQVEPQLATLVAEPPEGDNWFHEIKLDGYRLLCHLNEGKVSLKTRNKLDWTKRFPELAEAMQALPVRQAVLDGEVVALLPDGESSFQALQTALSERKTGQLAYYAFDLLYLDGYDLRAAPLERRKERLAEILRDGSHGSIVYSDHWEGDGGEFLKKCCQMHLEGIVSKQRGRAYQSGRTREWLKIKCIQRDEFAIGGFTDSTAARKSLGALLVGYFDKKGDLVYSGKVGTGFSDRTLRDLRERLKTREQKESPFDLPERRPNSRGTHWVRPELVAQVEYSNWTRDGMLRHPVFQGLREDKPAAQIVRDQPAPSGDGRHATKHKTSARRANASQPESKNGHVDKSARPRKKSTGKSTGKSKTAAPKHRLTSDQQKALEQVKLTHPDRVLYASVGITKLDLVMYYGGISDWILPHLVNRPLSLVRCPEGEDGPHFFQKHAGPGTPQTLRRVIIKEKGVDSEPYLAIDDLAGLASLVQMGVLEIHPWGATTDDVDRPDRMIFDLDPDPTVEWKTVIDAAIEFKDRLEGLGLETFLKTTGGKGLHVVVPLQRRHTWPEVKEFSKSLVGQMATDSPTRYTSNLSKAARHGKIFVDYLRNQQGATAVAAYSTRAREGAPVSTPLAWSELSDSIGPDHFHVGNIPRRLASLRHDPWEELTKVRQSLTAEVRRKLKRS